MKKCLLWIFIAFPYALFAQDFFLDRSYDQVIFPATWHWASINSPNNHHNALVPLERQLSEGARALIFSVFLKDSTAVISNSEQFDSEYEKLENELKKLDHFIEQNPQEIITLLIDNQVPLETFQLAFDHSGITKRLYIHPPNAAWPKVGEMIKNGHNIVLFVKKHPRSAPTWMHNWQLYGRELHNDQQEIGELAQKISRPFLLYHFQAEPGFDRGNNPTVQSNSKFLEDIVHIWSQTGKLPNFVAIRPFPDIYNCQELNQLLHISGKISYRGVGLRDIYWANNIPALSSSSFSFPAHLGDQVKISPSKPGFEFQPPSIVIDGLNQDTFFYLEVNPINISEGISGYYPFEEDLSDISKYSLNGNNFSGKPLLYDDAQRGNVLKLDGASAVELGKAEDYQLNAHDFTISIWLKVEDFEGANEGIISTLRRNYREGLHLILRNRKPYLGFHTNDTQGNTSVDTHQWYHIVWRYRADVGEQAIFVNGKVDVISRGHPAFKGRENIILGMRKNAQLELDFFKGYMDDLIIWERALGEHEIIALSQGERPNIQSNDWYRYVVFLLACFLLSGVVYGVWKSKTNRRKSIIKTPLTFDRQDNVKNEAWLTPTPQNHAQHISAYLYFFGSFRLIDGNGEDISKKLSPKIRRIFSYIILHQFRYNKGVSSSELERVFWKNLEEEKAANNRRVSIRKLRASLETTPEINLTSKDNRWIFELHPNVHCDLLILLEWLNINAKNPNISKEAFLTFRQIFKGEHFLGGISSIELDEFYAWIGHQILDIGEKLLNIEALSQENRLWIIDTIITYDPLHEEAIKEKIAFLLDQNQVNTAKYLYKDFSQLYWKTYDEAPPTLPDHFSDTLF